MQQMLCQLRLDDGCRSETARYTNKSAPGSSSSRTIAGQKKARCTEVHRAPWSSTGRVLLFVQLLPRILDRGAYRLDLDVGELAADPAHFAQILVLYDVARRRVDRDRPARAVRVLEILQELHGPVRIELAFLLADRVHDGRHAVVAAHGDEVRRLVRAVVALPRGDEGLVDRKSTRLNSSH